MAAPAGDRPGRARASPTTRTCPSASPALAWEREVACDSAAELAAGTGAPPRRCNIAVAGDALYLHEHTAAGASPAATFRLTRFDIATGDELWARDVGPSSTVDAYDDIVVISDKSHFEVYDAATGELRFERDGSVDEVNRYGTLLLADGITVIALDPHDRRRVCGHADGALGAFCRDIVDRRRSDHRRDRDRARSSSSITAPATSAGRATSRSTRERTRSRVVSVRSCTPPTAARVHEWDAHSGWLNWSTSIPEAGDIELYREVALVRSGADADTIVAVERETGEVLLGATGRRGRHAGVDHRAGPRGRRGRVHPAPADRRHRQPHVARAGDVVRGRRLVGYAGRGRHRAASSPTLRDERSRHVVAARRRWRPRRVRRRRRPSRRARRVRCCAATDEPASPSPATTDGARSPSDGAETDRGAPRRHDRDDRRARLPPRHDRRDLRPCRRHRKAPCSTTSRRGSTSSLAALQRMTEQRIARYVEFADDGRDARGDPDRPVAHGRASWRVTTSPSCGPSSPSPPAPMPSCAAASSRRSRPAGTLIRSAAAAFPGLAVMEPTPIATCGCSWCAATDRVGPADRAAAHRGDDRAQRRRAAATGRCSPSPSTSVPGSRPAERPVRTDVPAPRNPGTRCLLFASVATYNAPARFLRRRLSEPAGTTVHVGVRRRDHQGRGGRPR